jgi:multidrug resistance efflux pump
MSEEQQAAEGQPKDASDEAPRQSPVRRVTQIVLIICVVVFVWYIRADRFTPYTDQATVRSVIVPLVPQVAGYLTEVNVRLHSRVSENDVLFRIDHRKYELAVKIAEADVDRATQEMGARGATVKSAAARVGVARAQLDRAQRNYNRTERILEDNPGALSQADRDRTETSLAQATENLAFAEADLDKANEQLGTFGPENPTLRRSLNTLEQSNLDLEWATIRAPSGGVIESFNIDMGFYAAAGQPLATFVSSHDVWIQADMRENNISNMKPGDPVEFVLDVAPGRVFKGAVRSIGYGVATESGTTRGDLPTVSQSQGWLRDPQRFPVIVAIQDDVTGLVRAGGQVDVIVYADGGDPLLRLIGRIQVRLRSWISYVR